MISWKFFNIKYWQPDNRIMLLVTEVSIIKHCRIWGWAFY